MITLTVISFNGAASEGSLSAAFDELGGTIGRADTNQLVLPDPERTISRVHAQVVFRNGGFAVVDRGSNPIAVNGRTLGNGKEAPVSAGDRVQIGGYLLEVRSIVPAATAATTDPFAGLLGPEPVAGAGKMAAPFDPLAGFGKAPAPAVAPSATLPPAGGIPADWDPFAPPPAPTGRDALGLPSQGGGSFGLDATGGAPAPLIPDLDPGIGRESSLDNLFGLSAGTAGADPFANSMLDAPMAQPNMAAAADPMASLMSAPRATAETRSDHLSDLNRPFIPPSPVPVAPPPPLPTPTAAPSGAVLSWDAATPDAHTVIRPKAQMGPATAASTPFPDLGDMVARPAPAASLPPSAAPLAPVASASASVVPPPVPAMAATASAAGVDAQALLDAFREGLATPSVSVPALTPELMKLVGQLLHEATRGTVDLLVARAAMKREVRAEATMIMTRENNPLKFSPSVEAALGHLLAPPTRGFMAAAPAMQDAYDDLRAHQFGFVAGMRAALEGVLARFDPAQLESQLSQLSTLQSILPGARKARLWETFTELYTRIRADAADDFHTVFGKAFLKAYEEHIDQLKGDRS